VAQLLAVERLRVRIATDLHDDIGTSLSQIAILSEVARRDSENAIPRVAKPLSEIAAVSGETGGRHERHCLGHQPQARLPQQSSPTFANLSV
jgi:hypothetical protein